jgi:hypothetical protein
MNLTDLKMGDKATIISIDDADFSNWLCAAIANDDPRVLRRFD